MEEEKAAEPKKFEFKRYNDEELAKLVFDIIDQRVYLGQYAGKDIGMVFIPIGLGMFSDLSDEDISNIGEVFEYLSKAGPRSVNGKPCFMSVQIIHKDDWQKLVPAVVREQKRKAELAADPSALFKEDKPSEDPTRSGDGGAGRA